MPRLSPIRYLAITTYDGDRFIIRVTQQTTRTLRGVEVNRDGDEVTGRDFDVRERIIDIGAIKKVVEMRMDVTYGHLVRAQ